jgi:hypothetical protein
LGHMCIERVALLLPGRMLGPHVPLLSYAGEAAEARGAGVLPVTWPGDPDAVDLTTGTAEWVRQVVRAAVEQCRAGHPNVQLVAVAKSLSTVASPVLAELEVPAVLLTPVLTGAVSSIDPQEVIDGVRASTVPVLLVGGTGDPLWDGAAARSATPHVLEVAGADHAMLLPGRLAHSAIVLGRVVTAIEDFLDNEVWRL